MHYSIELWSNYNKVYQQLNTNIQGLNYLIGMFTERYKTNQNLASTLIKLSESKNNITTFESLLEGIFGFKGDMGNQYNYLSEFLVGLRDEIIKPLSANYQTFSKKLNQNFTETLAIHKAYQSSVNQLELSKNKFHSSVYAAEQCKLKAEYYKKKMNTINSKDNIKELKDNYTNALKQEEMKAMNLLKEAKESERMYISLINNTNRLQEEYIEIKKRNLNEIQNLEEELGEYIKDSLRKFIIFQVAYLRNMQYDVDKKAKILEGINIRDDIQKFIKDNRTNNIPPTKFEYIPYISKLGKKDEKKEIVNISPDICKEVNNFISKVFPIGRVEEVKLLKSKMKVDIEEIVQKIYNEEKLNFEDTKDITKIIMDKRARRFLLNEINNYIKKDKNNCLLNDNAYDIIVDIFKESLKLVRQDKDYETPKIIINLSSLLYKNSNDEDKEQIFIISNLKREKTIKSFDFWKELINYNIIEDIHNQKINTILKKEEKKENQKQKEDYIKKINEIVLNKLKIYSDIMMNFYCRANCIRQVVQEFKEFYILKDTDLEEINKKIEEYENEQLNKNDISTYSTEQNSSNLK